MVPRALRAVPIALTRVPGGFRFQEVSEGSKHKKAAFELRDSGAAFDVYSQNSADLILMFCGFWG